MIEIKDKAGMMGVKKEESPTGYVPQIPVGTLFRVAQLNCQVEQITTSGDTRTDDPHYIFNWVDAYGQKHQGIIPCVVADQFTAFSNQRCEVCGRHSPRAELRRLEAPAVFWIRNKMYSWNIKRILISADKSVCKCHDEKNDFDSEALASRFIPVSQEIFDKHVEFRSAQNVTPEVDDV